MLLKPGFDYHLEFVIPEELICRVTINFLSVFFSDVIIIFAVLLVTSLPSLIVASRSC